MNTVYSRRVIEIHREQEKTAGYSKLNRQECADHGRNSLSIATECLFGWRANSSLEATRNDRIWTSSKSKVPQTGLKPFDSDKRDSNTPYSTVDSQGWKNADRNLFVFDCSFICLFIGV